MIKQLRDLVAYDNSIDVVTKVTLLAAADVLQAQATKIAALRADAERLEWIEKRLFVRKWNGVIDGGSRTHWSIAGDFRHTTQRIVGITFRAAIDEARGKT